MGLDNIQNGNKIDILKRIIVYFSSTVAHLTDVKLDKLVYIANLYHFAAHGNLLTRARYFSLNFGPHAPLIRSVLKTLMEEGTLAWTESRTSSDPVYSNPCLIIRCNRQDRTELPGAWLDTLSRVVEAWGERSYEQILDFTTRTLPHLSTEYRAVIDWALFRSYHELADTLPLAERHRIHGFVAEPHKPIDRQHCWMNPYKVSLHEVAEIYLALRGDPPDKPPDRESLGFKFKAVVYAFEILKDLQKTGSVEYRSEIDKAALLTSLLINSMGFKGYSSRVALISGLCLLNKSGFSIDQGVLENQWPEGDSYDLLKEWFGLVSDN